MPKRGVIRALHGSWLSGIAELELDTGSVHCENAPTVRALEAAFGDVITTGHSINQDAIRGREIMYDVDEVGLLAWICPIEEYGDVEKEALKEGEEA